MGDVFQAPDAAVDAAGRPPAVWGWYLAYCGLMVALYAVIGGVCVAVPFALADLAVDEEDRFIIMAMPVIGVMCVALAALYAVPFVLGRSKAGYNLGYATIGLGLTGGLTVLPAVFLLIAWLDGKNKPGLTGEVG